MINNSIGNAIFTGTVSVTGTPLAERTVSNLLSETLTVMNTPIIGTTVIGKPGPTHRPGNVLFVTCVDPDGNLIKLTLNNNAFFQGITFFSNLYPGGSWPAGQYNVYVGAAQLSPTSMSPTFNNADTQCYPFTFPTNILVTPQVQQYYPTSASWLPNVYVPLTATPQFPSFLKKFSSASDGKNYLTVGYNTLDGLTLPTVLTGSFTVYACYMTVD